MSTASCKGKTQIFFGTSTERTSERRKRERVAKQICATCPVFSNCRSYISKNPEYGIWAGLTEEEREDLGYPIPGYSLRKRAARRRRYLNANKN